MSFSKEVQDLQFLPVKGIVNARDLYPNMVTLESCQQKFAQFMRMVVDGPGDGAIFFHCTQGKDRTGLASAYMYYLTFHKPMSDDMAHRLSDSMLG